MIDINENTYCVGVWFLQGDGLDWLAVVTREDDGPLTLTYRFRYYRDSKAFDSDDDKHWVVKTAPDSETEDQVIAVVDGLVSTLCKRGFQSAPWRRIIRGGAEATLEVLKTAPFIHLKTQELD